MYIYVQDCTVEAEVLSSCSTVHHAAFHCTVVILTTSDLEPSSSSLLSPRRCPRTPRDHHYQGSLSHCVHDPRTTVFALISPLTFKSRALLKLFKFVASPNFTHGRFVFLSFSADN